MKEYKDNLIGKDVPDEWEIDIMNEYPKAKGWLPFYTYDMVQSGYPLPDHGEMIIRSNNGTNEKGELLPGNGMWCKTKDIIKLLKSKGIEL